MDTYISQPELIGAILKHLDRAGVKSVLPRQMNAIIRCADEIITELKVTERVIMPGMGLKAWLACDQTGQSSIYMASWLGGFSRPYAHPIDQSDFGRCVGLLQACPELREKLPGMAGASNEWKALVGAWDELEGMWAAKDKRMYDRMQELLKQ